MSINIYCEECNKDMDAEDIICRACYDKVIAEFEREINTLQATVEDQANRIAELESER